MKKNISEKTFKNLLTCGTIYFYNKNEIIIRNVDGKIDYKKLDNNGFVDINETKKNLEIIKGIYYSYKQLYKRVKDGHLKMSFDNPMKIQQEYPYGEYISI